jgi:hypothetical protein
VAIILQSEPMFDSLLYTKFVVGFLMPLLTAMLLFNDVLLYVHVIAILMSLVVTDVTTDLM